VVNALSNHRATVHSSDGKIYEQEYEKKGSVVSSKQIGETTKEVHCNFYPEIFFTQTMIFL
jgi:DNA gyrase subunit B